MLLTANDPKPVGTRTLAGAAPFLLICDHAGNGVPEKHGRLGLPRSELNRHIGFDIGILGVSERLSDLLGAPLLFQRYSRLVIDANRRLTSLQSIITVSDGTAIPNNEAIQLADRQARIDEIFAPYHCMIVDFLCERAARGACYGANDRFTEHVLRALDRYEDLKVGRNEPYGVDIDVRYSIPAYGEEQGLAYAEFEIRQDLIAEAAGQTAWADRVADVLREAYRSFTVGQERTRG